MPLCPPCVLLGYCRKKRTRIVSDEELKNPNFIYDVRITAAECCVGRDRWADFLTDLYRDYPGRILNAHGGEVFLDVEQMHEVSPYWFRDFCISPRPGVRPRVRKEARERVRVLATLLRAHFPEKALLWGVRPANDNDPNFRGGSK